MVNYKICNLSINDTITPTDHRNHRIYMAFSELIDTLISNYYSPYQKQQNAYSINSNKVANFSDTSTDPASTTISSFHTSLLSIHTPTSMP